MLNFCLSGPVAASCISESARYGTYQKGKDKQSYNSIMTIRKKLTVYQFADDLDRLVLRYSELPLESLRLVVDYMYLSLCEDGLTLTRELRSKLFLKVILRARPKTFGELVKPKGLGKKTGKRYSEKVKQVFESRGRRGYR